MLNTEYSILNFYRPRVNYFSGQTNPILFEIFKLFDNTVTLPDIHNDKI